MYMCTCTCIWCTSYCSLYSTCISLYQCPGTRQLHVYLIFNSSPKQLHYTLHVHIHVHVVYMMHCSEMTCMYCMHATPTPRHVYRKYCLNELTCTLYICTNNSFGTFIHYTCTCTMYLVNCMYYICSTCTCISVVKS